MIRHIITRAGAAFLLLLLTTGFMQTASGQALAGTTPAIRYSLPALEEYTLRMAPPDLREIRHEDSLMAPEYRFAMLIPVRSGITDAGYWTDLPDGGRCWRISIDAPGALALSVYFDSFRLPAGGELYLYNDDHSQVDGPFTTDNNNASGLFAAGLIPGDRITLEYAEPAGAAGEPLLHVSEIAYAYRGVPTRGGDMITGQSGPCEVNTACSEGDGWRQQIRGITRIQTRKYGASYWCSGSLVNNTRNDGTPYVLTADHCGRGATTADFNQWIYYFNYESGICTTSPVNPSSFITGSQKIATGGDVNVSGSDFLLVLLNQPVPVSYNATMNGWNRKDYQSPGGVTIHHPMGDIKKISTYDQKLLPASWVGTELTHWKVTWAKTANGHGVTEGGSSGCPLFDNDGYIIGSLSGGESSCDSLSLTKPDYFGKFYYSWNLCGTDSASQLAPWLDPDNTGSETLKSIPLPVQEVRPGDLSLRVFPNPVSDRLFLVYDNTGGGKIIHISIEDMKGRVMTTFSPVYPGDITADVSGLTPGVYVISIDTGHSIIHSKFIKK